MEIYESSDLEERKLKSNMPKHYLDAYERTLQPSVWQILLSFMLSCMYGAAASLAFFKLKDAVPMLLLRLIPETPATWPQNLYIIITTCVAGVAWLVTFLMLWGYLEKHIDWKSRLRVTGLWCAGALAVYAIAFAMEIMAVRL